MWLAVVKERLHACDKPTKGKMNALWGGCCVVKRAHLNKKNDLKGCLAFFFNHYFNTHSSQNWLQMVVSLYSVLQNNICQTWKWLFFFNHSQVCSSTRSHAFFLRLLYDVRVGWCVIPLPESQNNTGILIAIASPSVHPSVLRSRLRLVGWLKSSTAPRHSGILWRREKAQLGRLRARSRAGRVYDVMWYDNTGGRLLLRADSAVKKRPLTSALLTSVCLCRRRKGKRRSPGGWPKRWVDVNRCSRWDALPSQCGGGGGGAGGGGDGARERGGEAGC